MEKVLAHMPSSRYLHVFFAALGLACCLRLSYRGYLAFRAVRGIDDRAAILVMAFFLVSLVASYLVIAVMRVKVDELFLERPAWSLVSLLACSVGLLLVNVSFYVIPDNVLFMVVAALIHALGIALSLVVWTCVLYRLSEREAFFALIIALPLLSGIALFRHIPPSGYRHLESYIVAACMCLSWFFTCNSGRAIQPSSDARVTEGLPLTPLVVLLASIFTCTLANGALSLDETEREALVEGIASLLISLMFAACLYLGSRLKTPKQSQFLAYAGVGVLFTSIALFIALLFQLFSSTDHLPATLINMTRRLCLIGLLVIVSKVMHEKALSPSLLASLFGISALAIPEIAGKYFVPALNVGVDGLIARNLDIAILVVSALFISFAFVSLILSQVLVVNEETEPHSQMRLQDAYDLVSQGYGLTPREQEVMQLIAKGTSMRGIADKLYISLGTVQSHSKNIYKKLGIHSRQELVDLIDSHCD